MAAETRGREFPDGFTWGTATAAHQIEGGNINNDWWAFEHTPGAQAAPSPRATPATPGIAGRRTPTSSPRLGLDNYRFSVEWSRIEPAEGEISRAALEHYRRQCLGPARAGRRPRRDLPPLHDPALAGRRRAAGRRALAVERFGRFCTVVAEALGDVMVRACTVNEPNIVATMGGTPACSRPGKPTWSFAPGGGGIWPTGTGSAVEAIRAAAPGVPVGLTLSMTDYQAVPGGEERLESIRHHAEDVFLDATDGDDFLGVQVYTRMLIGPDGWAGYEDGVPVLDMGYEFYPASLGNCLRRAWDYTGGACPSW